MAILAQNCPEWCLTFWATVDLGAILVGLNGWWKTDEIVYGLQDSGAKVLVADRKRVERITADLDECPELEHVYLIDCDPADVGLDGDERVHRFDELTAAPHGRDAHRTDRRGRPRRHPLHERHHRPAEGGDQHPPEHDRQPPEHPVHQRLRRHGHRRRAAPSGGGQAASLFTSPLFHVSGLHPGLVVGLLAGIRIVMLEGKFEPIKALELIQDEQIGIWATVPTMVWRVCEHPARRDYDTSSVRTVAFGGARRPRSSSGWCATRSRT